MPDDVFVIGTEFAEQTLIDKEVDIVFCNPPYKDFIFFSEKIIREANADFAYLVIPKRWGKYTAIAEALKMRNATVAIVGDFDFEDSEDRKARAKVSLVRVEFARRTTRKKYRERGRDRGMEYRQQKSDPFVAWFDKVFPIDAPEENDTRFSYQKEQAKRENLKELVKGDNLLERLKELYDNQLEHLLLNYRKVAELDGELLKELNIEKKQLIEGLKMKIKGLKNLYWQELFDNYEPIVSRLTSKSRKSLLDTLTANTAVDFTIQNAYSITIWAIANANKYYDSQLCDIYKELASKEGIMLYKSNQRILNDNWRYLKENMSHYQLDYRMVHYHYDAIKIDYHGNSSIGENAAERLQDIITVAKNLGYSTPDGIYDFTWEPSKKNVFEMKDTTDKEKWIPFVEVKAFKNGNMHFKFNQKFMRALNIEAARLNGWVKNPQEAAEEMNIPIEEVMKHFKSNYTLLPSSLVGLLPSAPSAPEEGIDPHSEGKLF